MVIKHVIASLRAKNGQSCSIEEHRTHCCGHRQDDRHDHCLDTNTHDMMRAILLTTVIFST